MSTNQNEIAALIRTIRQRTGLTQEKLASRLGVTFPTINRWEHGRARPSPLAVLRIKELLSSLGSNGVDYSEQIENMAWMVEDRRKLPKYKTQIVFFDNWPVLDKGTD
jgi:putative transcriptional regulator